MSDMLNKLAKYNFWHGNQPPLGYKREDYLQKISAFCNNSLIKVLVGQRRTGKSFLLRQIVQQLIESGVPPENTLYINKEFIELDDVVHYKDLDALVNSYKETFKPKGKIYLFIDEVQYIEQWEKLINSYAQNFAESYELFITGSNSKMLSGELATLLSGRYITIDVFPFGYKEFTDYHQLEANKESYVKYMETGGLPGLFTLPNEETKRQYVSAVKDTVLLRDIIQRYAIKEPKLLEDLFIYLINTSSNLLSLNNITNFFKSKGRKTTFDTVANYVGYIEEAFLVHRAERYDIRGKDTIAGNAKYYGNDLAFKHYLYKGFANGLGYMLENVIYLELRRHGYQVYVGVLPNKEVDFVAMKGERVLYIQSAYLLSDESTIQREFGALQGIKDHYEKMVVSLDDIHFPINNGIKHIQAWKLNSLL